MFGAGNQYKGILGAAQKMLAKQEQEQYRVSANVGDPFFKPGAWKELGRNKELIRLAYKNKSVFSPSAEIHTESYVFGTQEQRHKKYAC